MSRSLGEVEALARKATRGAGRHWGASEDAGHAVRWLEERGLAGAEALARLLEEGGKPCPLETGSELADLGRIPADLPETAEPLLLLPFLALAARVSGETAVVKLAGRVYGLSETGELLMPRRGPGPCPVPPEQSLAPVAPTARRAISSDAAIERLGVLAARTYAPATEASRAAGAGSGLPDND